MNTNIITFQDLQQANKIISYTNVKGKQYAEVNQRVKAFRYLMPCGTIETEVLQLTDNSCTIKAKIIDTNGQLLATGIAREEKTQGTINSTSFVENCETSAVGRALGYLGLGIDSAICSVEEYQNAIQQQRQRQQPYPQQQAAAPHYEAFAKPVAQQQNPQQSPQLDANKLFSPF